MKYISHALPSILLLAVIALIVAATVVRNRDSDASRAMVPEAAGVERSGDGDMLQAAQRPASSAVMRSLSALPPDTAVSVARLVEGRAQAAQQAADNNRRMRDQFAANYSRETADPRWAASKERALSGVAMRVAEAVGEAPRSLDSDCKRTMCKTSARFGSRSEAEQWVALYMASMGSVTARSTVSIFEQVDGVLVEIYSNGA
jgi:hypothetical protein